MTRLIFGVLFLFVAGFASAQGVEWLDRQENYQVGIGQAVRIPIRVRNTSDRAQTVVVRKTLSEMSLNQKGYFCLGEECLDAAIDQFSKKLEPGEAITNLVYVMEAGLSTTTNSFRFEAFAKGFQQGSMEHSFTISVEEKASKSFVFQSRDIIIHDVYPNPVTGNEAYVDYRLLDESIKAKLVVHNILGSPIGNYDMQAAETRIKISADELSSGVYFYTVYLDNVGVLTHKLVVRK